MCAHPTNRFFLCTEHTHRFCLWDVYTRKFCLSDPYTRRFCLWGRRSSFFIFPFSPFLHLLRCLVFFACSFFRLAIWHPPGPEESRPFFDFFVIFSSPVGFDHKKDLFVGDPSNRAHTQILFVGRSHRTAKYCKRHQKIEQAKKQNSLLFSGPGGCQRGECLSSI